MFKILKVVILSFTLSGICTGIGFSQSITDSLISSIVTRVNVDSVRSVIQHLQNYQTRFMLNDNRFQIADWLYDKFTSLGFTDVERDTFMCTTSFGGGSTTLQTNIIATLQGSKRPNEVYIIGGHYDSFAYGSSMTNAPGADDNASGTSAALEFARVIMESGYQPEATIKFIAFGAEELMLFGDGGCWHYAQRAFDEGMNIKLMINCDMISYNTQPLSQAKVSLNYYSGFTNLVNIAKNAISQFSMMTGITGSLNQYSDSYPFYAKGFPAIYFEEDQFSPFYHTVNDVITNYDIPYCSEVIKSAGAMILKYMAMNAPTTVKDDEYSLYNFVLHQNYPNPFNPVTVIRYQLSDNSEVTLKVYDVLGNEVATLVNEYKPAGNYEIEFDALQLSCGVYYYRLQSGYFFETKKMVLLK